MKKALLLITIILSTLNIQAAVLGTGKSFKGFEFMMWQGNTDYLLAPFNEYEDCNSMYMALEAKDIARLIKGLQNYVGKIPEWQGIATRENVKGITKKMGTLYWTNGWSWDGYVYSIGDMYYMKHGTSDNDLTAEVHMVISNNGICTLCVYVSLPKHDFSVDKTVVRDNNGNSVTADNVVTRKPSGVLRFYTDEDLRQYISILQDLQFSMAKTKSSQSKKDLFH